MAAGENFGILEDADPAAHHLDSTSHLVDQIEAGGLTWKTYRDGMGPNAMTDLFTTPMQ